MNFEELKNISDSAFATFGDKANHMTFRPKQNGCAAFTQSREWFLWYWFDYQTKAWKETHMLLNENWLDHE